MKAFKNIASVPSGITLAADDVLEFHAARLLLLIRLCGRRNSINGLTKLAKLDFFARYPGFFARVSKTVPREPDLVESTMVRHHYGPWDHRYYQVLAYLEAKQLISVARPHRAFTFTLTPAGVAAAERVRGSGAFASLVEQMGSISDVLGGMTGNQLKQLVYNAFEHEVADKPIGDEIS